LSVRMTDGRAERAKETLDQLVKALLTDQ